MNVEALTQVIDELVKALDRNTSALNLVAASQPESAAEPVYEASTKFEEPWVLCGDAPEVTWDAGL